MNTPIRRSIAHAFIALTLFTGCRPNDPAERTDETVDTVAQRTEPVESVMQTPPPVKPGAKNILLGLLLDTSNSMDGLIGQAKAQLWNIVNKLSSAECDGKRPSVQVALYEYGNDELPASGLHIRQVSGFTTNMDEISRALFELSTNGGDEYCGAVIARALDELQWGGEENDLRMLVIAGNEPFTQGPISFGQACERARQKGIVVNTIYCGEHEEGIHTSWQAGAVAAMGDYFSIDHNAVTMQIASPYDGELAELEAKWNGNCMSYGANGTYAWTNMADQDANAFSIGLTSSASRRSYKMNNSKLNCGWDLTEVETEALDSVLACTDKQTLPAQYRSMSTGQIKGEVLRLKAEKDVAKSRIADLSFKREQYVAANTKDTPGANQLESALLTSIEKHARGKGLTFTAPQPVEPTPAKVIPADVKPKGKAPGC